MDVFNHCWWEDVVLACFYTHYKYGTCKCMDDCS
jgi:hypothetical protein